MIIEDRYQKILDLVKDQKRITYKDLSEKLYVSESTIRRDIKKMQLEGLVDIIHGGVGLLESKTQENSTLFRETQHQPEKRYIAQLAEKFLTHDLSIFLDSSTTSSQLASVLNKYKGVTVITNGIHIALQLAEKTDLEIMMAGGQISRNTLSSVGAYCTNFIGNFNCDYAFFSCKGMSLDGKITEANINTQFSKDAMIKHSRKKILLIDHFKIGKTYLHTTCEIKDLDALICDQKPPSQIIEICQKCDVELLY